MIAHHLLAEALHPSLFANADDAYLFSYPGAQLSWTLQPIVSFSNNKKLSAEALLRAKSTNGRPLFTAQLVKEAERSGRIMAIDAWVCASVMKWMATCANDLDCVDFISVNLSAKTLCDDIAMRRVVDSIDQACDYVRQRLCVEITETAPITNVAQAVSHVANLQSKGVRVALDDYGSGHTDAKTLRQIPVDLVKISGEMSATMHQDRKALEAVSAALAVIRHHGASCVIEHIETPRHVDLVRLLGAQFAQGYAIAKPMAANHFLGASRGLSGHSALTQDRRPIAARPRLTA